MKFRTVQLILREQTEHELFRAKQYAELLFQLVPSAVFTVDTQRQITSLNWAAVKLTGYDAAAVIGKPCSILCGYGCQASCGLYDPSIEKPILNRETAILTREGQVRQVIKNAALLTDEQGCILGGVESIVDITERKHYETQLEDLSHRDPLTGLFNRRHLEKQMALLEQLGRLPISIIMIDIDDLKSTNDRHGHEKGDQLIQSAAALLRSVFRADDIIARFGGDEFVVLLPETSYQVACLITERVKAKLTSSNAKYGPGDLSLSFGIATSNDESPSLSDYLKAADESMYNEKFMKKNLGKIAAPEAYPIEIGQQVNDWSFFQEL